MTARERQISLAMSEQLADLLEKGTIQQIRAVGYRLRPNLDFPDPLVRLCWEPFDLPSGYVQLWFGSGFTCGVAPDGAVSS